MIVRHTFSALVLLLAVTIVASGQQEQKKSTRRGYLGVSIQDISEKTQKKYKLPNDEGAYVSEVVDDSPAEKSGIKEDDVILSFSGKSVYDADDLSRFVQRTAPDTKVDVVVWRDGARKTVSVTVGRQKRSRSVFAFAPRMGGHRSIMFNGPGGHGLQLMSLNEQLAEYFAVPEKKGVFVSFVDEKSAAEKAGVKAGDILLRVGTEKVEEPGDVLDELSEYDEGEKVELEVLRKGAKKTMMLEVEEGMEPHSFFFDGFHGDGAAVVAPDIRVRVPSLPRLELDKQRVEEDALRDATIRLKELSLPRESKLKVRAEPTLARTRRHII